MTPLEIGYLMVAGVIVLLALGIPVALSLLAVGASGLFAIRGVRGTEFLLESLPYTSVANLALIVIPLFILMGHFAFSAGLSDKAYKAAKAWVGHIAGGLPIATVFACAGFATVCGSSVATAATISKVTVPEMLRAGYNQRLAAGPVAIAGALGILIPPSGILVIYSIATNVSVSDLFIGALIPGILTAIVYAFGIYFMVRRDPELVKRTRIPKASWGERAKATAAAWEVVVLFLVVIGCIYTGVATATEAAGIGAALALVFALLRKGQKGTIWKGLVETGSSTASIFLLMIASAVFSVALGTTQLPTVLAEAVTGLNLSPAVLLLLLIVPYLILGCLIDGISMIFITMPVVFPIIEAAGIHPVLFGIFVTKLVEVGAVTPPVGINVFVVQGSVPGLKLGEIFRGVIPFILMELGLIGLMIAFPQIVTGVL
ncbi:MAG: TRAP dicarboxylate transporter subunit DctM [Hydrogenophaga sp. SCN 70-13]|uniref:TRAP transporter large permease n=1 Tax=unclassified Hydrogenophaga TaxID=2610897 RepID=UPI00086D5512|nr:MULTISPECIES: TRAP transporter large permease [unclassified Hydrogenophaga]MBN9373274.1 TRAP transporter large permease [Hydrogenophaga sp.]ODT33612.1 MAG: TRAP dicarboxylate transporter subunit DctM [Hydrogenophaga sp. SCN 70-13]OJV68311.1 MAG: TRAP dicarboxylate transporter subunit DctM [Hydrogenophaga sp. 70-12]